MSSDDVSDAKSCASGNGIGSHGPGWRRRRHRIEAELDEAHDINNFRVKVRPPGCLPQWESGPLVVPRLKPTYSPSSPPMPFARTFLGRLPAELRLIIYGYALGCPDRPLFVRKRLMSRNESMKLLPFECRQPSPHSHYLHDCWDGRLMQSDTNVLSLPLVCHQTYYETIGLLYSHRTFSFHNVESLVMFIDKTRPERLAAIRALSISTQIQYAPTSANHMAFDGSFAHIGNTKLWTQACAALQRMEGLRSLRLYVAKGRYTIWTAIEYQVVMTLEMLAAVRHVADFRVVFATSDEVRERLAGAPFELLECGTHGDKKACAGCQDCLWEA